MWVYKERFRQEALKALENIVNSNSRMEIQKKRFLQCSVEKFEEYFLT